MLKEIQTLSARSDRDTEALHQLRTSYASNFLCDVNFYKSWLQEEPSMETYAYALRKLPHHALCLDYLTYACAQLEDELMVTN